MNLASYIGLPFKPYGRDRDGVDCWGLVRLFYQEVLQKPLPIYDFAPNSPAASMTIVAVRDGDAAWRRVTTPQIGDVAVFDLYGRPSHVGVMLDETHMLHVMEGIDSAIEPVLSTVWAKRLSGVFRYDG